MNTIQNAQAPQVPAAQSEIVDFENFSEVPLFDYAGAFRGQWRDVPRRDSNGNPVVGQDGKQVIDRRYKLDRAANIGEETVLQTLWLSEADAKAHGFEDGCTYSIRFKAQKGLSLDKNSGKARENGGNYYREFRFRNPVIVSVER